MANPLSELDTFVFKFRNLWRAGRNARLYVEANAGKANVSLHLDLGDSPPQTGPPQGPHHHKRNSPSQQRRRERRAELRLASKAGAQEKAEELIDNENAEEVIDNEKAEEATENNVVQNKEISAEAEQAQSATDKENGKTEEVCDEFCSDASFFDNTENIDDCENYLVKYCDATRNSQAQDALNFVE